MSESWRRANDLFHLALERPATDRDRFVEEACGSDAALRAEVRSLLSAHGRAAAFLESPTTALSSSPGGREEAGELVGSQIAQYRIERVLGRGGMGVVYLAEDTKLGRQVALKAISPDYTHDPARRERLRREARAAAGLTHPGIAVVYALEEFGDQVFIAAEYIAGETLREEIARGPLSAERTLETAIALTAALAAAHDRGVIHRDLKPENVIRPPSAGVKILDFGLAQMRGGASGDALRLTADGSVIGTPAYMAPEQIRRGACDARADLFSLGIVLFECLTGTHPFMGHDPASTIARILEAEPVFAPPLPGSSDRLLADELAAVIRTCLSKAPEARFASAHALMAALEQVRLGGRWQGSGVAPPAADPSMRWWQFHQAATCVCYAALLVPLWWSRPLLGNTRIGRLVFLAGLIAVVTAAVLRLHLWFAASSMPDEFRAQHQQSWRWVRAADIAFVLVLGATGLWVLNDSTPLAATLVSAAVVVALSFAFIEPATARAAFRRR